MFNIGDKFRLKNLTHEEFIRIKNKVSPGWHPVYKTYDDYTKHVEKHKDMHGVVTHIDVSGNFPYKAKVYNYYDTKNVYCGDEIKKIS